MNTSEVLYAAADHIERYGHHKGDGFADPLNLQSAACAHGCIIAAAISADGFHDAAADAARDSLREHIGTPFIINWNDAPERTPGEVVEALRAAAVIEAAKETAPVTVTA